MLKTILDYTVFTLFVLFIIYIFRGYHLSKMDSRKDENELK